MKNLSILIISFFLISNATFGQSQIKHGLWGSAALADFSEPVVSSQALLAPYAGLFVQHHMGPRYALRKELNYLQVRYDGIPFPAEQIEARLNYIQLAMVSNVYFFKNESVVRPKVFAGPSLGFLCRAEDITNNEGIKKNFRRADIGAIAGAGIDFNISSRVTLSLESRYSFGFRNVYKKPLSENAEGKVRNRVASLGLGFSYRLFNAPACTKTCPSKQKPTLSAE